MIIKKLLHFAIYTSSCSQMFFKKMRFSIKDFFSKCEQICSSLRIWSHLLKKSSMENFLFCVVDVLQKRCSWKFRNIHRKTLVLECLSNKFSSLKKDSNTGVFPLKFEKFFRTAFFYEHLQWLLPKTKFALFYVTFLHHFVVITVELVLNKLWSYINVMTSSLAKLTL